MSDHNCTEWIKGRCTECDEHFTDLVDVLQATITEQAEKLNHLIMVLDNIRQKTDFLPFTPESTYARCQEKT